MARRRFVQIGGELVEITNEAVSPATPMVQGEIQPYKSMIDGTVIDSRTKHREHLKKHGCVELGNDALSMIPKGLPEVKPEQRKELIRTQVASMTDAQFRQALRRDIDFVKWNSRR